MFKERINEHYEVIASHLAQAKNLFSMELPFQRARKQDLTQIGVLCSIIFHTYRVRFHDNNMQWKNSGHNISCIFSSKHFP